MLLLRLWFPSATRDISSETMPNDNDLVAIPREEYEDLLRCKEACERMLAARIHDCKVKMQMMEMNTMIAQAIPPSAQVQPLNDGFKFRKP